jgi:hypothetical protein
MIPEYILLSFIMIYVFIVHYSLLAIYSIVMLSIEQAAFKPASDSSASVA